MKPIYLRFLLGCCLLVLLISRSSAAQAVYDDDESLGNTNIGLFGGAALLDNDKFYPGGAIEAYVRHDRWNGAGIRLAYYRLTNLDSNWFQMPQFFWDVHFLKPEGRFDLFIGNGIGYSRFLGFNSFDNTFRLGANFWVTQRVGIAFLLNYSLLIHGSSDPNSSVDRDGALVLNGGVRFRF